MFPWIDTNCSTEVFERLAYIKFGEQRKENEFASVVTI